MSLVVVLVMLCAVRGALSLASSQVKVMPETVLGEGSYGVVVAAEDVSSGEPLVAKKCREDALSKKYFGIEKRINEKMGGIYRGTLTTAGKNLFSRGEEWLLFRRVEGRDLKWYLELGACGVDALAAAWGIETKGHDECCLIDEDDEECWSDPEVARASDLNAVVAARVVRGACRAVAALHANGICHRDVKPANLLVDPMQEDTMYAIDLGSAVDTKTKVGYDPKRSPVSPRYCAPETFVDLEKNWRTFDTYSIGVTALRFLLSPFLRSDADLDTFNVEFKKANFKLDAWLGAKLASTSLPSRLIAPLTAMEQIPDDSFANDLWRLLATMTAEDPDVRPDAIAAAAKAEAILRKHDLRDDLSTAAPLASRRFTMPKQQEPVLLSNDLSRATLEAPIGLDLEEADDDGVVVVVGVKPTGSAHRLGAPAVGDLLRCFEWVDRNNDVVVTEIESVDDATGAAKRFKKGALVEVQYEKRQHNFDDPAASLDIQRRKAIKSATLGCARRRGAARAAVEDAAAVSVMDRGSIDVTRLDAPDYALRDVTEERSLSLKTPGTKKRVLAVVADGHNGQTASRHCVDRLPELVQESTSPSPAAAVKGAWDRLVEEYVDVTGGQGAVAACALLDLEENLGAVLHCGDARVVAADKAGRVLFATKDHALRDPSERAAAVKRGVDIDDDGRVVAGAWRVAVPRALGSQVWRKHGIVPVADVSLFDATDVASILVASDGLWDVFSSDDAALYVQSRRLFRPTNSPSDISKKLAERAANVGSRDDISVALILLDR